MHRAVPGFTLVEVMLVVAIIGVLAALGGTRYLTYVDRARAVRAVVEIENISKYVDDHDRDNDQPPTTLAEVDMDHLVDPWGNPYEYLRIAGSPGMMTLMKARKDRFLVPLNTRYDLYSKGKDGLSAAKISHPVSVDDVVRASDGGFVGLASAY